MRVRDHVVISAAAAALAALPWGPRALGLWAGGVLIDVDHYVWYCLRQRRLNPVAAVRFFNQADPPTHSATRALHSPVVLSAALIAGSRRRALLPAAMGMALHVALDVHHRVRMAKVRAAALERDEFTCQACGSTASGVRAYLLRQPLLLPSYKAADHVSLCDRCHETAHLGAKGT